MIDPYLRTGLNCLEQVEWYEWCAQGDDLRTFLGDFVAAFHQIELPDGMNL